MYVRYCRCPSMSPCQGTDGCRASKCHHARNWPHIGTQVWQLFLALLIFRFFATETVCFIFFLRYLFISFQTSETHVCQKKSSRPGPTETHLMWVIVGRHNFKGSTAISQKCLQNISCTARNSITSSAWSKYSFRRKNIQIYGWVWKRWQDDACLQNQQAYSAKALICFDVVQ